MSATLHSCGCRKGVVRYRYSPEYRGLVSVHADGTDCSSVNEGEFDSERDARPAIACITANCRRDRALDRAAKLRERANAIEWRAMRAYDAALKKAGVLP